MKYNETSPFEKSPKERPETCAHCCYFSEPYSCEANGCRTYTHDFCRPTRRALPMPLNCFWWYANETWDKVSAEKIEAYREERLHLMTTFKILEGIELKDRRAFIDHVHRPGGGCLIDFTLYPQARAIYEELKAKEGGKNGNQKSK